MVGCAAVGCRVDVDVLRTKGRVGFALVFVVVVEAVRVCRVGRRLGDAWRSESGGLLDGAAAGWDGPDGFRRERDRAREDMAVIDVLVAWTGGEMVVDGGWNGLTQQPGLGLRELSR